jgi:hypothetical protein
VESRPVIDWTPASIERARARLLYDVSDEATARLREQQATYAAQVAAWGNPARCKTGSTGYLGECIKCGADQGEHSPRCIQKF